MNAKRLVKEVLRRIACRTFLAPKSFSDPPPNIRRIDCQWQEITPLLHTSNNVLCIHLNGENLFFRECKIHKEIHAYVQDEIDFYYTYICPDLLEDKRFVMDALSSKQNFNLFVRMGMVNDHLSGAYRFCMGEGGDAVGLKGAQPDQEERLKDFVQFIWGDLFVYTLNRGVKLGNYQTYNANRSIATRRMAELLGLQHLIPKTEYAVLCIDSKQTLFGTVMEQAPGICMEKMSNDQRKAVCSPALQKSLNELNLLDVICMEKDHRVGNYHVVLQGGYASSVVAFDNDSPASFGIGGISFTTYQGCSPFTEGKRINRPYVDKTLANSIIHIDDQKLEKAAKDLLNPFQMRALKSRIKQVQKILAAADDKTLITEEQWNSDTVRKELSGDYGKTYLVQFIQDQEIMFQPWIKENHC